MNSYEKINCYKLVDQLKLTQQTGQTKNAIKQCEVADSLWEKCVLLRVFTSPQSTESERIIRRDLQISEPLDKTSGDGHKNGYNFEIKVSIHDKNSNVNLRQIRPHHCIDFYIVVSFNLYEGQNGKANIFKIPSEKLYSWIPEYGGYTHGTIERNGEITIDSVSDVEVDYEYSLTAKPNGTNSNKQFKLWQLFEKYEVEYLADNF